MLSAALTVLILSVGIGSPDIPPDLETETRIKISGSYRSDTLDFDDNAKTYGLLKGSWMFSPRSSFNCAFIRTDGDGKESSTWNLILNDASNNYKFIAGDYFVNFGAGLAVGKKSYYSSDVHSGGIQESRMNPFSACSSGNPRYAFSGAAVSAQMIKGDDSLTLNFFYSLRNRYAEQDAYTSGGTAVSQGTILGRFEPDAKNTEPVSVRDAGIMAEYHLHDNYKLQFYAARSSMSLGDGLPFHWNRRINQEMNTAEKSYLGSGIYAEYSDDYVDMFAEGAYTSREFSEGGREWNEYDSGFLGGFRFSHPVVNLSLLGKQTGAKFYSIYSSGTSGAERGITGSLKLRLTYSLRAGGEYSYQQALSYRTGSGLYPVKKRKKIFSEYNLNERNSLEGGLVRTETDNGAGISTYDKLSGKYFYKRKKVTIALAEHAHVKNNSARSYNSQFSIKWFPVKGLFFSGECAHIVADKENPVYSGIGRSGFISGGSNVTRTCEAASVSGGYRSEEVNISAGYTSVFNTDKILDQRAELSAGAEF